MFTFNNFIHYIPEFVILISAFLQLFCKRISLYITFCGLLLAILSLVTSMVNPNELYCYLFKILICIASVLVLSMYSKRKTISNNTQYNFLYLISVFFLCMIINSKNFLGLYLNIELFSISMYFLLSIDKAKLSYSETVKYLVSSSIASSFVMLGAAFIYGLTGTLSFQGVYDFLANTDNYSFSTYIVPYIFIISGLMFKLGGFPFGNWLIDIYKNIDTKTVTFLSVIPKLSIFAVMIKVLGAFITFETSCLIILFALFTGVFGAVYGIKSRNLKVLMACSSYINMSYILIALALYTKLSISTMIFYWIIYVFMNIGAFAGIVALEHSNLTNKCFDFKGYFYKNPVFSICFAICIISLLGLPISGGFIAKLYLLAGVINSGIVAIPLILAMFTVMIISAVLYLKIIKNMITVLPYAENRIIKTKINNKVILYLCSIVVIITGIFPAWFIKLCETISFYVY